MWGIRRDDEKLAHTAARLLLDLGSMQHDDDLAQLGHAETAFGARPVLFSVLEEHVEKGWGSCLQSIENTLLGFLQTCRGLALLRGQGRRPECAVAFGPPPRGGTLSQDRSLSAATNGRLTAEAAAASGGGSRLAPRCIAAAAAATTAAAGATTTAAAAAAATGGGIKRRSRSSSCRCVRFRQQLHSPCLRQRALT